MMLTTLKRGLVFITSASALVFFASHRVVNSQTAQQAEKTIEQTHKDIKVLNGMPDSQLGPIMNYFNAALGVQCNFCHVRENNQMAFDKDHEHKTIAREMVKMTKEINKNSFNGRNQISCYTCHQGRANPQGMPALPLAAPNGPPPGGPRPGGPGAPGANPAPTAEQVWDKYVQAVGGKEAIAKINSRVVKATMTSGQTALSMENTYLAPNKVLSVTTSPNGEDRRAYDGTGGWVKDARGQREMNPGDINGIKESIEMFDALKFNDPAAKFTGARRARVNDRDAIVLSTTRDGKRISLFFDAESGLLLRKTQVLDTAIGRIPDQVDYEDYQVVDGVKLPMTIKISSVIPRNSGTLKVTEVKFNTNVDSNLFMAPK